MAISWDVSKDDRVPNGKIIPCMDIKLWRTGWAMTIVVGIILIQWMAMKFRYRVRRSIGHFSKHWLLDSHEYLPFNVLYPNKDMGLALSVDQFHQLADRLRKAGVQFIIEPHLRFEGQPGEQYTMFFKDPSGTSVSKHRVPILNPLTHYAPSSTLCSRQ
jgi:hypothetical protein